MAGDDSDLLTASQAGEALSASSQSIRNWIREGRLAAVRIGNRFLIPRSEVERLRGDASAPVGESPWAFSDNAPAVSLPRARAATPGADSDEGTLGG